MLQTFAKIVLLSAVPLGATPLLVNGYGFGANYYGHVWITGENVYLSMALESGVFTRACSAGVPCSLDWQGGADNDYGYGEVVGSFEGQTVTPFSHASGYAGFKAVVLLTDEHVPAAIPVWVYGAIDIPGKKLYFTGNGTTRISAGEINSGPGYTQFIFYEFGNFTFEGTMDELPEPSTFALFIAGTLAGLVATLRRRKAQSPRSAQN